MEEEREIKVYIKVNENNEIIEINSEIFINDFNGWILIDKGFGDRYSHAQGNYLSKPLINDDSNYNYKYINDRVVDVLEEV